VQGAECSYPERFLAGRGSAADAPGELPFSFLALEDSKHAYYLVFDFKIEVADPFVEHLGDAQPLLCRRGGSRLSLCSEAS